MLWISCHPSIYFMQRCNVNAFIAEQGEACAGGPPPARLPCCSMRIPWLPCVSHLVLWCPSVGCKETGAAEQRIMHSGGVAGGQALRCPSVMLCIPANHRNQCSTCLLWAMMGHVRRTEERGGQLLMLADVATVPSKPPNAARRLAEPLNPSAQPWPSRGPHGRPLRRSCWRSWWHLAPQKPPTLTPPSSTGSWRSRVSGRPASAGR